MDTKQKPIWTQNCDKCGETLDNNYSNYCNNSQQLLQALSKTKLKEDIHYFCIEHAILLAKIL